ncbi:DUF975 family protein [Lactobacillus sp. PV034]|uniref:DUF975 family protein n=1 Tax=Lactobacillus sp. PV034 TaxID=2594495 RepID=UPI00223FD6EA|nr:DUF975 family protein [Lactobacillus sp. PV034]QNQ80416.1 DUF975 family protein [Lactobacillus sp. PV034]
MKFSELKSEARSLLSGHWGWGVAIALVNSIFAGMLGSATSTSTVHGLDDLTKILNFEGLDIDKIELSVSTQTTVVLSLLVAAMIGYSIFYTFLRLVDTKETGNVATGALSAITSKRILPTFLTSFMTGIFVFLWSLLLIVPGIIKGYAYSMAPYIVKDLTDTGKEVEPTEAINLSREIMKGHKWQLFCLDLSFIGWFVLSIITLGIGFLWLRPYFGVTRANYYRHLVGDRFTKA